MSGIVFFKTRRLDELKRFYLEIIGCTIWQDQDDCVIFSHGNLLFGLCQREGADLDSLITFFYDSAGEVDRMYGMLKSEAISEPVHNGKYNIYQFYARDPEGRNLEFQYFERPVDPYLRGDELLVERRSVRYFLDKEVPDEILSRVWELCRYAPTARNTQGYYFKVLRDREIIGRLAAVRGTSSAPIARAPLAVVIGADPALTARHVQDGCIGAYHFLLAARTFGLGTCWIGDMDREEVKDILGIPQEHYVATVSPLGYPQEVKLPIPERRDRSWFLRE